MGIVGGRVSSYSPLFRDGMKGLERGHELTEAVTQQNAGVNANGNSMLNGFYMTYNC